MKHDNIIIAFQEEIGNPALFVGRVKELDFLLDWSYKTKNRLSRSTAILSRRKKGKTALVQRLYNILYTQNDPQVIPFYFKVEEGKMTQLGFSEVFYKSLIKQYLSFKLRDVSIMNMYPDFGRLKDLAKNDPVIYNDIEVMESIIKRGNADLAWNNAREAGHRLSSSKDERIIQIIDEFQHMNKFIYTDNTFTTNIELARFYQSTAESKVSPQLITGSYIGWLLDIIRKMVARYREWYLEGFTDEESLDAVYNYSNLLRQPVTDFTAAMIAKICVNDPFYIAMMLYSTYEGKDLTDPDSVISTFEYETTYRKGQGEIARVWMEYIWDAFERVNDKNAKAIVLYLAKHGDEERTREQILADLRLDMTDSQLEERLIKLVKADIISEGSTNFRYKGLGDEVFNYVFRKLYSEEIERIGSEEIKDEMRRKITSLKNQISYLKGVASEYKVINFFLRASLLQKGLGDIVKRPLEGYSYKSIIAFGKHSVHLDQEKRIEVDLYLRCQNDEGADYIVEVKDWKAKVTDAAINEFIEKKKLLESVLTKKTGFIFYSANGVTREHEDRLWSDGIMVSAS